ncbi:1225_t:CDS:1, partial [Ambispora leptoticha]
RDDQVPMESYLANYCTKTPASVIHEYLQKLSSEDSEMVKKK